MSKTNTNTAADITAKINTAELAAAYKRIVVSDSASKKGTYDIAIEFLRKHGGSAWRNVKLAEGLTMEQTVVAVCVLRKYCVEETRNIDMKDHIPVPDKKKKGGYKTKVNEKPSSNPAAGIVAVN